MDFKVPEMSCGHCTSAIEKAIKAADPAAAVSCDLTEHVVSVKSQLATGALSAAIKDAGYDSQPLSA
ncbi:cation transporter [Pseudooceanicola sp. CBS1P-1]|uniref:Copper chaperone n=1 Tax=Pseudooceanicola albus TaxID=2692189 RepID=A0A6L7GA65_9RHOB|nr:MULTISPECIES: cation transporter [Pseudooceanicola]MBT9386549.1 cation transporter [Pseudooceanicola endophyticus]MXN20582.1 copper chaperone [Pseudooceanicola albus]